MSCFRSNLHICSVVFGLCTFAPVIVVRAEPGGTVNEVIIDDSAKIPFSNKTDWYKPEPKNRKRPQTCSDIPGGVMRAVAVDKREQAVALLGKYDVVSLGDAQVRELVGPMDPDKVLEELVRDRERGLTFLESNPADLKNEGVQMAVRTLKQQIVDYRAWRHGLRPYLIKAVSLNPEGLGFNGTLADTTLFVDQISPGGGTMINMPIVAFLPVKPDKIYTSLTTVH